MYLRNPFSLLLFLLLSTPLLAQHPGNYPSFEEVLTEFFSRYEVSEPANNHVIFERRPNGYFAVVVEWDFSRGKRELFYRFSTNKYADLRLFTRGDGELAAEKAQQYLKANSFDAGQFSMLPYFGYPGWYKDVIALYEKKDSLSDWELNALARSYQNARLSLLQNISGYSDPADQFDLPPGRPAMTPAQVDQYLDLAKKNLQAYDRLRKKNPDFMTPVGPVTTKYSNEVMDVFVQLLFHQDESTARRILEPGLYEPYLLVNAANMLKSCPPDAVLLVWGDTDTYPLYYLQAMENLRTDVILINLSLAALPRYLSMVYSGPMAARPLKTGLPELYFRELIMWQKDLSAEKNDQPLGIESFYAQLADTSLYTAGFKNQYRIFPRLPNLISLPAPGDSLYPGMNISWQVEWLADGNYLFPEKTAQLDLVYANNWSRPLCYAISCRPDAWAAWNPHLALEGLVYRLYPQSLEPVNQIGDGIVKTEIGYRLWMEEFEFNTSSKITPFDKAPFHQANFIAGIRLAEALRKNGEKEKALDVARSLPQRLPNAMDPWNQRWVHAVQLLGELGDPDLGETIAHVVLTNYETGLIEAEFAATDKAFIKESLRNFAVQYEKKGLKKRCEKF